MLEPSENDIKKEKQSELDAIANANAKCVAGYQIIRQHIFDNLEKAEIEAMNKYIIVEYGKIYGNLKQLIIDGLNEAKVKNVEVVEKLLDLNLRKPKLYKTLPKTPAFKYTNAVFTKKSVSVRSKKAADTITKIIADGRNDGLALVDIQKKIDVVMGFRDKRGVITKKAKALIESGKFTHRNGSIYETYRIVNTELARMNAIAKYEQLKDLNKEFNNCRLKLKAIIDGRERPQSRAMNGFISDSKGRFIYPDGKYYHLGSAPARWSINDRETSYFVFLNDSEIKNQYKTQAEQRIKSTAVYGAKN
jgi:hypothetical protein